MNNHQLLKQYLHNHPDSVGKVVDYNPANDRLFPFDFTSANTELTITDLADTARFSDWVNTKLFGGNYKYGVGGYMEHRIIYGRSSLFSGKEEPRRLHLGVDIWAPADTPVYAPLAGKIHSFKDNNNFGDYGPTIILQHDLDGLTLYSLYGHLSRESLKDLYPAKAISLNQQIATFGNADENGSWPPHLHFQLMFDIGDYHGDYPGVGRFSEQVQLMENIPDPDLILCFK